MTSLESITNSMPVGLERSVGRILSRHVGRDNGVTRDELLAELRKQTHLVKTEDRHMRIAIQKFREQGVRICHFENRKQDPETKKFTVVFWYYLAANKDEYVEFRARYMSYAKSIWNTTDAMDKERPVLTEDGLVEPPPGVEVQGKFNLNY